jgi:hypothetical protein
MVGPVTPRHRARRATRTPAAAEATSQPRTTVSSALTRAVTSTGRRDHLVLPRSAARLFPAQRRGTSPLRGRGSACRGSWSKVFHSLTERAATGVVAPGGCSPGRGRAAANKRGRAGVLWTCFNLPCHRGRWIAPIRGESGRSASAGHEGGGGSDRTGVRRRRGQGARAKPPASVALARPCGEGAARPGGAGRGRAAAGLAGLRPSSYVGCAAVAVT